MANFVSKGCKDKTYINCEFCKILMSKNEQFKIHVTLDDESMPSGTILGDF